MVVTNESAALDIEVAQVFFWTQQRALLS